MVRRFAVCVLVGTLGLGVAPRPAAAAPARVVTGNHYRCMYHCDERGQTRPPKSGRRSLAQTTTTPPATSTFCQRNAPAQANPQASFADMLVSWLYAAFCTSPTAQPAAAPAQPTAPQPVVQPPAVQPPAVQPPVKPPVLKPPGLTFPPIQFPPILKPPTGQPPPPTNQPPPMTGKPGPWWPFPSGPPNNNGPSGWGYHGGGWGDHGGGWGHHDGGQDREDGWEHREKRDHGDAYRWECRTKRHDDAYRWDCRKKRGHDDDDRREHRHKRDHDNDRERRKKRDRDDWR